jgi:hypothetical protein
VLLPFSIPIVYHQLLSKSRLFANERLTVLLIFAICVTLRAIPELMAYPHPIGYDVINYYIPTVTNLEDKWDTVSREYPLYVTFLYSIGIITGLPAHSVVVGVAIAMTGIFGISLFYSGRTLLQLTIIQSAFVAIFAIFQLAVLRTTWDLHRDIFTLATMLFVFCLLVRKDPGWKPFAITLALAALTVAMDRMVGALFCISIAAYAFLTRRRDVALLSIVSAVLFFTLTIPTSSLPNLDRIIEGGMPQNVSSNETSEFYNPTNLFLFFSLINGLIAVPAAIGVFKTKNFLLKIPLLVCLIGSFTWLAFPDNRMLLADRWIILTGIFLSVFAGYGILQLIKNARERFSIASFILGTFVIIGLLYAIMPHSSASILYGIIGVHAEDLPPVTMQFNSLGIEDNDKLLSTIAWINENTEIDAVIVGEKHWRGFMEMYLDEERTYYFSQEPQALANTLSEQEQKVYLVELDSTSPNLFVIKDMRIH